MSFFDKARQAADQARQAASASVVQVTSPESQGQMRQAAQSAGVQFKEVAGQAKRGVVTAIERIDPGILADIVIKATALQETANRALRGKGSAYRIGEITITATIPPQIGFAIQRLGDVEEELPAAAVESQELVETVATADEQVVSLEGDVQPVAADGPRSEARQDTTDVDDAVTRTA